MPAVSPTRRGRRASRRVRRRRAFAGLLAATVLVAAAVAGAVALAGPGAADAETAPPMSETPAPGNPASASPEVSAPGGPEESASGEPSASEPSPSPSPAYLPCESAAVRLALQNGTDEQVIAAFGGGEAFRAAVASGDAPCVDLGEAGRTWVLVNKRAPLDPIDYWPTPQARPTQLRVVAGGGWLRADVATALDRLAEAVVDDGAGRLGVDSAFRPYAYQVDLYNGYVASRGREAADLRSARPGHSEHQSGLAVDVVACGNSGCGTHDGFRGTSEAGWLSRNSWRYGFIVRYEDGETATTGYSWEPWHLRYIGVELAEAYHAGGYRTLEEFFAQVPAPDYG